jgi:hypothetical protein
MSEKIPEPDVTSVESALRKLTPQAPDLDRDQLFFRAGQASMRRRAWVWPGATGIMGTVAASLTLVLLLRPPPATLERIVYVTTEPAPTSNATDSVAQAPTQESISPQNNLGQGLSRQNYFKLEDQLLRWGLDALAGPTPSVPEQLPLTVDNLLGGRRVVQESSGWTSLEFLFK